MQPVEQPSVSAPLKLSLVAASVAILAWGAKDVAPGAVAWVADRLPNLGAWVAAPPPPPPLLPTSEAPAPSSAAEALGSDVQVPPPPAAEVQAAPSASVQDVAPDPVGNPPPEVAPSVAATFEPAPPPPPPPPPAPAAQPPAAPVAVSAVPSAPPPAPASSPSPPPPLPPASASSVPPAALASAEPPGLPRVRRILIPEGTGPSGAWTPNFHLYRDRGDANLLLVEAQERCAHEGYSLCSETQWKTACALDPELGAMESWTITPASRDQVVLRGGTSAGCNARGEASFDSRAPRRVGVCCERAVAIRSEVRRTGFLRAAAERMLAYEKALGAHDVAAMRKRFREKVSFFGVELTNEQLGAKTQTYFDGHRDAWAVVDSCESSVESPALLIDTCTVISYRSRELGFVTQRFVHTGKESRIEHLSETQVLRPFTRP